MNMKMQCQKLKLIAQNYIKIMIKSQLEDVTTINII